MNHDAVSDDDGDIMSECSEEADDENDPDWLPEGEVKKVKFEGRRVVDVAFFIGAILDHGVTLGQHGR